MKAVVLRRPCAANELKTEEVPVPDVKKGWVLVKVKAFGINRSELFTRKGQSPSVKLPRIIGIECVGEVADPSDSHLTTGQRVVSMMGGLGRDFDGSYAEYALIPKKQVYPVDSHIEWTQFAAMPEMYYTAWCSLTEALKLKKSDQLLIRGGTSSVGLAACQIARAMGVTVAATTRKGDRADLLRLHGADVVLTDDGTVEKQLKAEFPHGANKVLELIGTKTMQSSFSMLRKGGTLCMSGILGGEWSFKDFAPMDFIPSGSYLTIYDSQIVNTQRLNAMFAFLEEHDIKPTISKVVPLDDIPAAHSLMESNTADGKIVVTTQS